MSEQSALQSAADEARKAARAAREAAALLDNYAKQITRIDLRAQADDLRLSAVGKVTAVTDAMTASHKWLVISDQTSATQPLDARAAKRADVNFDAPARQSTPAGAIRVTKKESKK